MVGKGSQDLALVSARATARKAAPKDAQSTAEQPAEVRRPGRESREMVNGASFTLVQEGRLAEFRFRAMQVLRSPRFDAAIGMVILANSVTIGIEISYNLEGKNTDWISHLEVVFLVVYVLELSLRFFVMHLSCLKDNWVVFDCFLVASSLFTTLILEPMESEMENIGADLGILMVLRTCRLLRLARAVRLLVKFRELWILVRGLLTSFNTMVYTLMLLTVMLYLFSCAAVELITTHELASGDGADPVFEEIVEEFFRSVPVIMLTLVQFVCLDSVSSIYKPLIERAPMLAIYFIGTILIISIVLMNLVTAVIVNSALEQAESDKGVMFQMEKLNRQTLIEQFQKMFERLDEDGSGKVSMEELNNINADDWMELCGAINMDDPVALFHACDVDGGGELDIKEFCEGIRSLSISNVPIELLRVERQVNSLRDAVMDIQDFLGMPTKKRTKSRHRMPTKDAEMSKQSSPSIVGQTTAASHTENSADSDDLRTCSGQSPVKVSALPPWAHQLVAELNRSVELCASDALEQLTASTQATEQSARQWEALDQAYARLRAGPSAFGVGLGSGSSGACNTCGSPKPPSLRACGAAEISLIMTPSSVQSESRHELLGTPITKQAFHASSPTRESL